MSEINMTGAVSVREFFMSCISQMSAEETDEVELTMEMPDGQTGKFSIRIVEVNGVPIELQTEG